MRYSNLMRVASLQPSITVTLSALNRLDRLCACTKYCLEALPDLAARNHHILHDSRTPNTQDILATHPDLVIASANPAVLLLAWCGAGNRVPLDRVIEQRNWHHLKAVQERRVFCIPDQFLNTPAPPLLQGLACIAATTPPPLHPPHPDLIQLR